MPEAVALRVREAIAAKWRIDATVVSLAWGPVAPGARFADTVGFRLLGDGRGGRFVVALRTADRREVAVTLRAGRADSIWTAARPLSVGAIVGPGDAVRTAHVVFDPPGAEILSPIGWEVRRGVAAGDPLVAPVVAEPVVIVPGDAVKFAWDSGPIRVVREGIAQTRARRGQPVWARDPVRGERLQGIAIEPGRARVVAKGAGG